jgi:hypothetical protein
MSAIITDQFRILNAENFVASVANTANSYYAFMSLSNPTGSGYGRTSTWNDVGGPPFPVDNFNYSNHVYDTMLFGKRINSSNTRRLVRKVNWVQGSTYDYYRHDVGPTNPSQVTNSNRLYDSNFYIVNSEFRVYICLDNGTAAGISTSPSASLDEPTFTDVEPSRAGTSGDGYLWKYLYTISPSDIVKFDSTEYITVPNDWLTTTSTGIQAVRDNANSEVNNNQIKIVAIDEPGLGYPQFTAKEFPILGDGQGGKVRITTNSLGQIVETQVTSGGSGYSFGRVDLSSENSGIQTATSAFAKLTPIIPPSKGHGYNIYSELGADKVLMYARFDNSSYDFADDTVFAQVGILKNPALLNSDTVFTDNQFSSLYSIKYESQSAAQDLTVGDTIQQTVGVGSTAKGIVASYDTETKIIKYYQDRSLYYNVATSDETDAISVRSVSPVIKFTSSSNVIEKVGGSFSVNVDQNFSGVTTTLANGRVVNLGVNFTDGLANPEINKRKGEIIYLDNRPSVTRNERQKEDVKIVLEF